MQSRGPGTRDGSVLCCRMFTERPQDAAQREEQLDEPRHLLDLIWLVKPRAALFTTYTFSVGHFDAVFVPVLRSCGCQDISVLVDADEAAHYSEESRSRAAGRVYRVAPVIAPGGGVFHPKLAYLAADADDVLAVGSGNLTASGQSLQLESFDSVSARVAPMVFRELADHLQRKLASKAWIHHPRLGEYEAALLAGFDDWRTKRAAEILLFTRLADERKEDAAKEQRRRAEVQRRNNEFRQRPLTEKWARLYDELGVTEQNWPRHLAVEVREGADAFKVTKEMWQGALFSRFIFGCGKGDRVGQPVYSVPVLENWIAQRYGVRERSSAHAQSAIRL